MGDETSEEQISPDLVLIQAMYLTALRAAFQTCRLLKELGQIVSALLFFCSREEVCLQMTFHTVVLCEGISSTCPSNQQEFECVSGELLHLLSTEVLEIV